MNTRPRGYKLCTRKTDLNLDKNAYCFSNHFFKIHVSQVLHEPCTKAIYISVFNMLLSLLGHNFQKQRYNHLGEIDEA